MKRRLLLLTIVLSMAFMIIPAQKTKAIDPVTIAILAPLALKAAQVASPYVIKGLKNLAKGLVLCGKDLIEFFKLPIGFVQVTLGIPFGGLPGGIRNIVQGTIAPFRLGFHTMMLPLNIIGVGVPK